MTSGTHCLCGYSDCHDRWVYGRIADCRRCGRVALFLAGSGRIARSFGRQSRSHNRAMHPASCGATMVISQFRGRPSPMVISIRVCVRRRARREAEPMTVRDCFQYRRCIHGTERTAGALRWMVVIGFVWIAAMILIAATARLDKTVQHHSLRPEKSPRTAGNAQHWLGTDELGRDVLSYQFSRAFRCSSRLARRCFRSVRDNARFSLQPIFGGSPNRLWSCWLIFERAGSSFVSLAVLAFFRKFAPAADLPMGFCGWERYARIARGLAVSANAQGYAAAVMKLGATPCAFISSIFSRISLRR